MTVDSFKATFEAELEEVVSGSEIRTEGLPETKHGHSQLVS